MKKHFKLPKPFNNENRIIIIAAGVIAITIPTVILATLLSKKANKETFVSETEVVASAEFISETESKAETQTETESKADTTKKPDVVKPVGTTKPVEKETNAPVVPKDPPVNNIGNNLHLIDVPYINQRDKYPTGCESISAVMALQFSGYFITPETFIDNYLPKGRTPVKDENNQYYGDDPRECFLGDPYQVSGWGCYAPVIEKSMNEIINHSKNRVVNLSGTSIERLCQKYIDNNIPVIIWATQNMQQPKNGKTWLVYDSGESFTWISGNHCLLLVGYDDNYYYFNDPLQAKNYYYERAVVESRYASLGCQALAIIKVTSPPTTETTTETTTEDSEETTESTATQESTEAKDTTIKKRQ